MAKIINGQIPSDNQKIIERGVIIGMSILAGAISYIVAKSHFEEMINNIEEEGE